jgi:hypothetical protein
VCVCVCVEMERVFSGKDRAAFRNGHNQPPDTNNQQTPPAKPFGLSSKQVKNIIDYVMHSFSAQRRRWDGGT